MKQFLSQSYIIIALMSISCNREQKASSVNSEKASAYIIDSTNSECKCLDSIGSRKEDSTSLVFHFSNGQSASVCGYVENTQNDLILSEFKVFSCDSGDLLLECDATQLCKIVHLPDTLSIQELRYLPVGKDWSWKYVRIAERIVTVSGTGLLVSKNTPKLEKYVINEIDTKAFLNSIRRDGTGDIELESEIGKLEALSLAGNRRARWLLKNYEEYKGRTYDGAIAEYLNEANAIVDFILESQQ